MTILKRTHCKYGHELTEENTYQVFHKNGTKNGRRCRLCTKTLKNKEYKARKAREYYAKDPEKIKEQQRLYKEKHPKVYIPRPKTGRTLKTHCSHGHELIEENLYRWVDKDGNKNRACKACHKEKNSRRSEQLRDNHLQRKYGITIEEFNLRLEEQKGCCYLCGTNEPGGMGSFAVDHCHTTFVNRKLLCYNCNTVLGKVNDDPELLRKMADYIESYK